MESSFSLSDTLAAVGMPDAFQGTFEDFSRMYGRHCRAGEDICLVIPGVLHKASSSVDETGT